jgi:hypothetical protein
MTFQDWGVLASFAAAFFALLQAYQAKRQAKAAEVQAETAYQQAKAADQQAKAAEVQAEAAQLALKQTSLIRLFSTFDLASQVTIENPELLSSVHGLPIDGKENLSIAYLSLLLDAFQHYYGEKYDGNFDKMRDELIVMSTFLNRILEREENQKRWDVLKKIYYGTSDSKFTNAIDEIIKFRSKKK